MQHLKYPTGQQDFKYLRENGYIYVDKTDIIYRLVHNPKYVFLARPRRFGKSLLLSTLETYFEGRKEFFRGLAIASLEKEWKKYPVFHLELSGMEKGNFLSLKEELERQFRNWEEKYEIEQKSEFLSSRFRDLIQKTCEKTGEKVVVLIDEYDNPLVNSLDDDSLHDKCRNLLKSVYSAIKGMDRFIRFAMITGVSRFSKTSIFSGLNNLNDISFDDAYATLCGFTRQEILKFLKQGIKALADKRCVDEDTALQWLKERYDGYHFSGECEDIYNPFSLLNALEKSSLGNYWIMSGTPTFLIERLKRTDLDFVNTFGAEENVESLGTLDVAQFSPVALLYQTGYLTIKAYNQELDLYRLGIPNKEVNYGLFGAILSDFSRKDTAGSLKTVVSMKEALIQGHPERFMEQLQSFYAGIPFSMHPNKYELNFEKILYSLLHLMDLDVWSEVELADGRIDLLIKTGKCIYIIELKLDGSPEEALRQIQEKGYASPYILDGRKIFKIGVNFSSETRQIESWKIQ